MKTVSSSMQSYSSLKQDSKSGNLCHFMHLLTGIQFYNFKLFPGVTMVHCLIKWGVGISPLRCNRALTLLYQMCGVNK